MIFLRLHPFLPLQSAFSSMNFRLFPHIGDLCAATLKRVVVVPSIVVCLPSTFFAIAPHRFSLRSILIPFPVLLGKYNVMSAAHWPKSHCRSPLQMSFFRFRHTKTACLATDGFERDHLAKSTARVSRMTLTLICPGYSISFSMRLTISLARMSAPASLTSSGLTMMRTSRPDWIA